MSNEKNASSQAKLPRWVGQRGGDESDMIHIIGSKVLKKGLVIRHKEKY